MEDSHITLSSRNHYSIIIYTFFISEFVISEIRTNTNYSYIFKVILISEFMNPEIRISSTFSHLPGWWAGRLTDLILKKPLLAETCGVILWTDWSLETNVVASWSVILWQKNLLGSFYF